MAITVTQTMPVRPVDEMYLEADLDGMVRLEDDVKEAQGPFKSRPPLTIVWRNVVIFAILHLAALVGLYYFLFEAMWLTSFIVHAVGTIGVTAGPHRLWSHRSYKATTTARAIFMLASTVAFQNDVIEWSRDHRCHHKWTDTEADPHNAKRGFFYSHVGWLMARKTEQIKEMGAKIDLSDLYADPVLVFQRRHYYKLVLLLCFLLPAAIPVFLWGESPLIAFFVASIFRYTVSLNNAWLINSAAHTWGYRPYDASISPAENIWMNFPTGEGGHNFHHTFPQDYRASEMFILTNWTRIVVEFMAKFGMVYDMKVISDEAINRQMRRAGDPKFSHIYNH